MNRLFIRILACLFLALMATIAGVFMAVGHFYGIFFSDPEWYPVRHTTTLVQSILDFTPAEEIPQEREWLQDTLDRQIDIVATGQVLLSPTLFSRLSEGGPVFDGDDLFYIPIHGGEYMVMMSPSFHQYKTPPKRISVYLSFLFIGIVAAAVGFFMTRPLARRLNELESAAERIRQGDIGTRVKGTPSDLIGNVGRCFNQMAGRIQSLIEIRQKLLNSVARKFHAPVQEISRHLNSIAPETDAVEVRKRARDIDSAVDDIEQMVTDLLLHEKKQRSDIEQSADAPLPSKGLNDAGGRRYSGVMKFITRMCLGILAVLLLHQLFMIGVSQLGYKYLDTDPASYPARTLAALIARSVQRSDRESLPVRLDSLRKSLDRRIDLLPAEAGTLFTKTDTRELPGQMTYGKYNGNNVFSAPVSDDFSLLIEPGFSQYRRKPSALLHSLSLAFEFLVTTLFGVFLSLPITRNIKKLEEGIERIHRGDFTTHVDIPGNKPTGPLARCLNHMARRIQSLLEHQKHIIQAVAHEIRTPVSRIRFHLEMLSYEHDDEERKPLVAEIRAEVEELNLLVSELMTFSALDTMAKEMETHPIALHDYLSEIVAYYRKPHAHIEIVLQNTTEKNLKVNANPVYFKRAIQNILSNALRHAQKKVLVCYAAEKEKIRVDILDDGAGIPANLRESVFQPFTRLDGSRNRNSGGFGLGLAIVDRIISLHSGSISIGNNSPSGAVITTLWPAVH